MYPHRRIDEDVYLFMVAKAKKNDTFVWFEEIAREFAGYWRVPELIEAIEVLDTRGILVQSESKNRYWLT